MSMQQLYSEEDIRREVKNVIAIVKECEPDEISDSASFEEDLQIDSLSAMEILVAVEKKYKFLFPEEEFVNIKTVNDAVAVTQRYIAQKAQ